MKRTIFFMTCLFSTPVLCDPVAHKKQGPWQTIQKSARDALSHPLTGPVLAGFGLAGSLGMRFKRHGLFGMRPESASVQNSSEATFALLILAGATLTVWHYYSSELVQEENVEEGPYDFS